MGNQRVPWLWWNMTYWVKVQTWIGSMNLSGTTHLKLESRPAFRNFPDSANLEDKKGRFESQLPDLSFAFMSDFFKKRIETFSSFSFWGCSTKHDKGERGITWRVFCCQCMYKFRYRYINLENLFGLSFRNFHRQDLFSLNLDLVYGGIRCHSFEKRWKHYSSEKNVRYHK